MVANSIPTGKQMMIALAQKVNSNIVLIYIFTLGVCT